MKTDTEFLKDFSRSQLALNKFVEIQQSQGVDMMPLPYELRQDSSSRRQYSDDGDGILKIRFEHKKRKLKFTCKGDFPYEDMIVDEVYNYEQKKTPWLVYFIENDAGTHLAVVWNFTRDYWGKITMFDRQQNRRCDFYTCPTKHVWFCPIDEVFVR